VNIGLLIVLVSNNLKSHLSRTQSPEPKAELGRVGRERTKTEGFLLHFPNLFSVFAFFCG
jgi:hypothetical protein